jgi:hypothetical protein
MRNETSFTAPTAKKAGNNCQLGFFVPEPWQSMIVGHIILTHLACRTCRRCAVTEEEGEGETMSAKFQEHQTVH